MLYRLLMNYARIKLMQMLLNKLLGKKKTEGINTLKNMSLGAYIIELVANQLSKSAKKPK